MTSPDARLQRPEYLGGNRTPINVNQVIQQSGTGESVNTPQGTVVGMSLTTDSHSDFTKSFTEHGFIIGVMVARYDHTYQQGLNRLWSRKDKFDYYWPVFANIGEQAIKNKEIYAQGNDTDDEVLVIKKHGLSIGTSLIRLPVKCAPSTLNLSMCGIWLTITPSYLLCLPNGFRKMERPLIVYLLFLPIWLISSLLISM